MKHEVAKISVEQKGPHASTIRVSYQTPEWSGAVEHGGGFVMKAIWLVGSIALAMAAYNGLFNLPTGKAIVATCIVSLIIYWLVWNLNSLLQGHRHARGIVKDVLEIEITPQYIAANGPDINFHLPRDGEVLFTAQPHRHGKYEEREERRTGRHPGYTYQDAFEIWLQASHHFERLASVADEKSARTITRHCQEADERATRGADQQDAFTTRNQPV